MRIPRKEAGVAMARMVLVGNVGWTWLPYWPALLKNNSNPLTLKHIRQGCTVLKKPEPQI